MTMRTANLCLNFFSFQDPTDIEIANNFHTECRCAFGSTRLTHGIIIVIGIFIIQQIGNASYHQTVQSV